MSIYDELRRILTIISVRLRLKTNIEDTKIIAKANRPSAEIENHLNELESLGLIEQKNSPANVDYKRYKITRNGIKELYNKEFR